MVKKPVKKTGLAPEAKVLLTLGLLVLVVFGLIVAINRVTQPPAIPPSIPQAAEAVLIKADSPTLGPTDAKVTIVEFLDPECETCRAMFPHVKRILKEYEGRVRLVVRYFPLHNNSILAAAANEAAGEQGKYWEMQELLFTNQPTWGEQRTPQTDAFMSYATQLGLDIEKFRAAMNKPEYAQKAERDLADGKIARVQGTPTFFFNNRQIRALSYEELKQAVEDALSQS
jgi:protein-disulfide isomerase